MNRDELKTLGGVRTPKINDILNEVKYLKQNISKIEKQLEAVIIKNTLV